MAGRVEKRLALVAVTVGLLTVAAAATSGRKTIPDEACGPATSYRYESYRQEPSFFPPGTDCYVQQEGRETSFLLPFSTVDWLITLSSGVAASLTALAIGLLIVSSTARRRQRARTRRRREAR